jgi:hypothetical protein
MRQPPASWHTDAPDAVAAHTREQHDEQPGQTSPSMAQLPIVGMAAQMPALLPDGIMQLPLQQSLAAKQTSPSGWQPAAVVMHAPPLQFFEQQSLFWVHELLSVVQLPLATGAHEPLAQSPLQQSLACLQLEPFCVQAAPHLPPTQLRPQHCTDEVQVAPWARQPPVAPLVPLPMTQVLVVPSQLPTQQSPLTLQACAGAAQELVTPPSPPPPCISFPVAAVW